MLARLFAHLEVRTRHLRVNFQIIGEKVVERVSAITQNALEYLLIAAPMEPDGLHLVHDRQLIHKTRSKLASLPALATSGKVKEGQQPLLPAEWYCMKSQSNDGFLALTRTWLPQRLPCYADRRRSYAAALSPYNLVRRHGN